MTMIINRQPEPPPPAPPPRPPVLDRAGLEQAERSLCAIRFFMRFWLCAALIVCFMVMVFDEKKDGIFAFCCSLMAIFPWLLIEAGIIAARACVATAWAARKPDGQP